MTKQNFTIDIYTWKGRCISRALLKLILDATYPIRFLNSFKVQSPYYVNQSKTIFDLYEQYTEEEANPKNKFSFKLDTVSRYIELLKTEKQDPKKVLVGAHEQLEKDCKELKSLLEKKKNTQNDILRNEQVSPRDEKERIEKEAKHKTFSSNLESLERKINDFIVTKIYYEYYTWKSCNFIDFGTYIGDLEKKMGIVLNMQNECLLSLERALQLLEENKKSSKKLLDVLKNMSTIKIIDDMLEYTIGCVITKYGYWRLKWQQYYCSVLLKHINKLKIFENFKIDNKTGQIENSNKEITKPEDCKKQVMEEIKRHQHNVQIKQKEEEEEEEIFKNEDDREHTILTDYYNGVFHSPQLNESKFNYDWNFIDEEKETLRGFTDITDHLQGINIINTNKNVGDYVNNIFAGENKTFEQIKEELLAVQITDFLTNLNPTNSGWSLSAGNHGEIYFDGMISYETIVVIDWLYKNVYLNDGMKNMITAKKSQEPFYEIYLNSIRKNPTKINEQDPEFRKQIFAHDVFEKSYHEYLKSKREATQEEEEKILLQTEGKETLTQVGMKNQRTVVPTKETKKNISIQLMLNLSDEELLCICEMFAKDDAEKNNISIEDVKLLRKKLLSE